MSQSKKELFLELAQPDKNRVSRWVSVTEFVGKYQGLQLGSGGVGAGITHLWLKNLNLIKGKL
ncbi:hypothetical protein ECC13_05195 [Helicobacter pylori]|nr:hypothetical protein ECC13_05195 [Helicobacter pylori]